MSRPKKEINQAWKCERRSEPHLYIDSPTPFGRMPIVQSLRWPLFAGGERFYYVSGLCTTFCPYKVGHPKIRFPDICGLGHLGCCVMWCDPGQLAGAPGPPPRHFRTVKAHPRRLPGTWLSPPPGHLPPYPIQSGPPPSISIYLFIHIVHLPPPQVWQDRAGTGYMYIYLFLSYLSALSTSGLWQLRHVSVRMTKRSLMDSINQSINFLHMYLPPRRLR